MGSSLSRRRSILLTFEKLTNWVPQGKHNATKPNNAWWRWIRPGHCNPPVITKTADYTAIVCSKLLTFQLGHCRQKQASTRRPAPSGHPQLEIRTVSKSEAARRCWM
jgi:hypothetical protein